VKSLPLRALSIAALAWSLCAPAHAHGPMQEQKYGPEREQAKKSADPATQAARRQVLVMLRLPAQHFRPDASYGGGYLKDGGSAARRRVAGAIASAHGLRLLDSWPMPAIGVDCFVMEEAGDAPIEQVVDALSHDGRVAWAQPLADYHALDSGDPLYPLQPARQDWRLADLHRVSQGRNVNVAVIDSGVDAAHPDLLGRVKLRRNFVDDADEVPEAHGTAVAGIIGALAGNGAGIAGVAPGAKLMALRACWEFKGQAARCNSLTLGKAINYALENGAQVINLSLAGPPDRLLQALLQAALARDVVVIGAADPHLPDGGFPAAFPGVIGVARTGDPHPASSKLVYAPGSDVPTCAPGKRWTLVSGSSYAAAHVAGLAALVMELKPRGAGQALQLAGARGTPPGMPAAAQASGTMDVCAALSRAADTCVCLCPSTVVTASPSSHLR
jgi:subtilisin family serine protease